MWSSTSFTACRWRRRGGGTPVDIWTDQPLYSPAGCARRMGRLLLAENGNGTITALTVHGDNASVVLLKDGLQTPTGVEPEGNVIWIAERGAGTAVSIPMVQ